VPVPERSPVATKSLFGVRVTGYESDLLVESDLDELLLESAVDELSLDDELESLLLLLLLLSVFDRFDGPEYKSDSQPPPFKIKLPPPIMRRALSLPHFGHFLSGFSVMRCSRSNSWRQLSQA
jgi:hypothetical protein